MGQSRPGRVGHLSHSRHKNPAATEDHQLNARHELPRLHNPEQSPNNGRHHDPILLHARHVWYDRDAATGWPSGEAMHGAQRGIGAQ